ncbi:medium-chain acyl-CoA ligase ACSF2, mitochondrial isoform X2 [Ixodes scapularis]
MISDPGGRAWVGNRDDLSLVTAKGIAQNTFVKSSDSPEGSGIVKMESGDCAVEQQPQPTAETAAVDAEIADNTAQDSAPEGAAPQDSSNGSDGTAKGEKNDASDAAGVPAKTEKKGTYYCDVCDESVPESAENHLRRRKHTRLLERLEKYGSLEAIAATFKLVRCNICGTQSNTKEQLQYHLDGQKHRTRCLNLGISPTLTDLPPGMRQTRMPMHPPASRGGPRPPLLPMLPPRMGPGPWMGPRMRGGPPMGGPMGMKRPYPIDSGAFYMDREPFHMDREPFHMDRRSYPLEPLPPRAAKKARQASNMAAGAAAGVAKPSFFCEMCNLVLNSIYQRDEHIQGTKHKDRAIQAGLSPEEAMPTMMPGPPPQGQPKQNGGAAGKQPGAKAATKRKQDPMETCAPIRKAQLSMSYFHKPGGRPLLCCTTGDVVDKTAEAWGDRIAVVSCHQELSKTYTEFKKDVNITTECTVPELQHSLKHVDCEAVVLSEKFASQDHYAMLLEITPELKNSKPGELKSARLPRLKHVILIAEAAKPGTVTYDELIQSVQNQEEGSVNVALPKVQYDDPVSVQFTSGTTGKPKSVLLSHFNIVNNAETAGHVLGFQDHEDIVCLTLPMSHPLGCIAGTLAAVTFGRTLVLPAPVFDPTTAFKAIKDNKCTAVYGTPSALAQLPQIEADQSKASTLRKAIVVGSSCSSEFIKNLRKKLCIGKVHVIYGSAECSPAIAVSKPEWSGEDWMRTVGTPVDHVEVNITTECTVPELQHSLKHVDCEAVVLSEKFASQDHYAMLLEITPELKNSKPGELKSARLPRLKHVILIAEAAKPGTVTYDELIQSVQNQEEGSVNVALPKVQYDDPVSVQFTSGTTGKPKSVLLSHFNIVNNAETAGHVLGFQDHEDIVCLTLPMSHPLGCIAGTLAAVTFGRTLVLPAPVFDPTTAFKAIKDNKCTAVYGTPSALAQLPQIEADQSKASTLRKAIVVGSSCSSEFIKNLRKKLCIGKVHVIYGSAECSPAIAVSKPEWSGEDWMRTVGTPVDHVEVKVVDSENKLVPSNSRGELCVRGHPVFMGYCGSKKKTEEAIRDGWYHTGDEATLSEDGRLTICGRIQDRICRGEDVVDCREIEECLSSHTAVEEAQVVAVSEEICACLKLKPESTVTEEEVKDFCKEKISEASIPKYVLFVDSFPKSALGQVQKIKMRTEAQEKLGL